MTPPRPTPQKPPTTPRRRTPPAAPTAPTPERSGRSERRAAAPLLSRWKALPHAGRLGGVLSAVVLVAAGGGLVSATALSPQGPGSSRPIAAPLAAVPAGSSIGVCPGPARLLEGSPVGTDPQFSPESATAKSDVNAVVLGSSAGVLPGSRLASLTGSTLVELAKATPASGSPSAAATRPANGTPVPLAGVVSQRGVDDVSVLSADCPGRPAGFRGSGHALCRRGRGPPRFGGRSVPAARQRSLARRREHRARPDGRAEPHATLPAARPRSASTSSGPRPRSRPRAAADSSWPRAPPAPSSWPGSPRDRSGSASGCAAPAGRWPRSSSRACCGGSRPAASSSSPRPRHRPSAR